MYAKNDDLYFYFQINDEDVHLYKDAVSGRDIVECKTTVCAIRPCKNGAVCTQHEDNGSWFCNCPPGFTGSLCERPVCTTNPCCFTVELAWVARLGQDFCVFAL